MVVWRLVQAEIAKFTQVCAYDRAGLGFSDAATRPSDVRNMTDDLHRLLVAADIPRPIVFVGHSLAGEIAVLFAATYPDELAGAVLVEPGFAGMVQELQAELPPANRTAIEDAMKSSLERQRACLDLARDGKLTEPETEAARQCVGLGGAADESERSAARILALPRVWEAMISEMSSYVPGGDGSDVNSAELAAVAFSFGDKPLIVLTRGRTEGRRACRRTLSRASKPRGKPAMPGWRLRQAAERSSLCRAPATMSSLAGQMLSSTPPGGWSWRCGRNEPPMAGASSARSALASRIEREYEHERKPRQDQCRAANRRGEGKDALAGKGVHCKLGCEQGCACLHGEADPDQSERPRRGDSGVRRDRERRASMQDEELGAPQGEFASVFMDARGREGAARRAHERRDAG